MESTNAIVLTPTHQQPSPLAASQTPHKRTRVVIRTGCIACLREGIPCNGRRPTCHRRAISEAWRTNAILSSSRSAKACRERRGMLAFVRFATTPEHAAAFASSFWTGTVLRASIDSEAVYHAAAAIGTLHEHILRQMGGLRSSPQEQKGALADALQQCNVSIRIMKSAASGASAETALITCVLFAVFEALCGDTRSAYAHARQAWALLCTYESGPQRTTAALIDPLVIRPIIGAIEGQARAVQGKCMKSGMNAARTLPDVTRLHSLDHASTTLNYVRISVLMSCQDASQEWDVVALAARAAERDRTFTPWLFAWEHALNDLLKRDTATPLSRRDTQRIRILRANRIIAGVLAKAAHPSTWAPFDSDCKLVIELATTLLASPTDASLGKTTTTCGYRFPFFFFGGLDILEPLFIVMARCSNRTFAHQAGALLIAQPRLNTSQPTWALSSDRGVVFNPLPPEAERDTDSFGVEEWVAYTAGVPLDIGMVTFFGRLPSGYIKSPVARGRRERPVL